MVRVTIHDTSTECGRWCDTANATETSLTNMPVHYAMENEVAKIGHELEIGFSTAGSCSGGGSRDCTVFPELTVYQAMQLRDAFNLKENTQCIQGQDGDADYCGIVKYDILYHIVNVKMPYDKLFSYYLLHSMPMAGVGTAAVGVLWKRGRPGNRRKRAREERLSKE